MTLAQWAAAHRATATRTETSPRPVGPDTSKAITRRLKQATWDHDPNLTRFQAFGAAVRAELVRFERAGVYKAAADAANDLAAHADRNGFELAWQEDAAEERQQWFEIRDAWDSIKRQYSK